jgi:hypothetical protein
VKDQIILPRLFADKSSKLKTVKAPESAGGDNFFTKGAWDLEMPPIFSKLHLCKTKKDLEGHFVVAPFVLSVNMFFSKTEIFFFFSKTMKEELGP